MPGQGEQASQVLACWFTETLPRQWFAKDQAFDRLLRERFLGLTRRAIAGELDAWSAEASGALALVLLCRRQRCRCMSGSPIPAPPNSLAGTGM